MDYNKNYYELLGVRHSATQDEIKKAFYALALKYHPDRNPGNKSAEEKFKELSEAHEILSHVSKKEDYDVNWKLKYGDNETQASADRQQQSDEPKSASEEWDNELHNDGYNRKNYNSEKQQAKEYTYKAKSHQEAPYTKTENKNSESDQKQRNYAEQNQQGNSTYSYTNGSTEEPAGEVSSKTSELYSKQRGAKILSLVFLIGIGVVVYLISQKL